jgi:tetratricopeptide (TPR) repeat protein
MMSDGQSLSLMLERARAAEQAGNWDEALTAYAYASEITRSRSAASSQLLRRMGEVQCRRGQFNDAEMLLNIAQQAAEEQGDHTASVMASESLGTLAHSRGDLQSALEFYQSALTGFEGLGDDRATIRVLNSLALVYGALAQYEHADSCLAVAIPLSEYSLDPSLISATYVNRARLYLKMERNEEARADFDRALDTLTRVGE